MGGGGEAGQSRAVPGRRRSASVLSFCRGGMVMEGRLWTQVPPACFSAPCTRSHLPLLPSCFVLRGLESGLAAGAHLRLCSLAFLFCSFRNQKKRTFPISFSYFEEVKKGGEREGERERENAHKNWQKTLQENEFDRFVQFWISVFLFPDSVRKAKALPP